MRVPGRCWNIEKYEFCKDFLVNDLKIRKRMRIFEKSFA